MKKPKSEDVYDSNFVNLPKICKEKTNSKNDI